MNIFRYCGDFAHLLSFFIIFYKILTTKQVGGISLKTQVLYVIVFCTRYIDLLWNFASMYNWCMKILFIASSVGIVFIMLRGHTIGKLVVPYDPEQDCKWPIWWLIVPCLVMGIIWHEYSAEHRFFEILWSFSVWLEAVAILPQVAVMQNEGECENVNSHYVAALGSYRAFYILNWIYRKFTDGYWHPIVVVGGILQTALYCDFFYYYITAKAKGGIAEPVKVQVDAGVV